MANVQYEVELTTKLDKIDSQLAGVERKLDSKFKNAGKTSGTNFLSGFSAIAKQLTGVIAGLGFLELGKQAVLGADSIQRAIVKYETLLGSAEEAKKRVDEIINFAKETPFKQEDIIQADTLLQGFGIRTKKNLDLIADASAISGNNIGDLALIFGQLSQNNSLENIKQLAERGVVTFQELKDAGLEFAKDGSIVNSTEETFDKILKIIDKKFAGGSEKISKTFSGQFSTAIDNFNLSLGLLAQNSGILTFLTDLLGGFNRLVETSPELSLAFAAATLGVAGLAGAFLTLGGPVTLAIAGVVGAIAFLKFAFDNDLGGIQAKVAEFVKFFQEQILPNIQPIIQGLIDLIQNIYPIVKPFIENFFVFFGNQINNFLKIFKGITDVVRGVLDVINGLFTNDGTKIRDGFSKIFTGLGDIVKNSFNAVIDTINASMSGFNELGNAFEKLSGGKVNVADIPKVPKLANGGSIIPPGYNNDTFPLFGAGGRLMAMAQSGERIDVVPRNQVSNVDNRNQSNTTTIVYTSKPEPFLPIFIPA